MKIGYDLLIITITLTSIIIILAFFLVKMIVASINENRVKHFALDFNSDNNDSIADVFVGASIKVLKLLSKRLNSFPITKKYSEKFDKYLIYFKSDIIKGIDFISIKLIFMLFIDFLYILTTMIKYTYFNIGTFVFVSIISFFVLDIIIIMLYNQKKKLIEEQLLQAIVIMNSAFKSGKNILDAITIVKKELPSPIKEEFEIIYKDLGYGLDINATFIRFASRIKLEEAKYITASLSLLSKTGGNIVTVFNMIENNFYDRLKIKNELGALTSSSKFLYKTLIILPIFFVLVIVLLNKSYFVPLLTTTLGYILDGIIVLLYFGYILLIKRVTKVDKV